MCLVLLSGFCSGLCSTLVFWCLISSLALTKFLVSSQQTQQEGRKSQSVSANVIEILCADLWKRMENGRAVRLSAAEQHHLFFMAYYPAHRPPTVLTPALTWALAQVTPHSSPIQAQKPLRWTQRAFSVGLIWVVGGWKWKPECFHSRE